MQGWLIAAAASKKAELCGAKGGSNGSFVLVRLKVPYLIHAAECGY